MKNQDNIKEKYGNSHPFLVPENYFDQFTDVVMSQLPEKKVLNESMQISLWKKTKPVLFAAALLTLFFWSLHLATNKKSPLEIQNHQAVVVATDDEMAHDLTSTMTSVDDYSMLECMIDEQ